MLLCHSKLIDGSRIFGLDANATDGLRYPFTVSVFVLRRSEGKRGSLAVNVLMKTKIKFCLQSFDTDEMTTSTSRLIMSGYHRVNSAIVFSRSLEVRDYLRDRTKVCGLNTVCFEKEAICFDNFRSIAPSVIIVHTDSLEVVWRFIFTTHTLDMNADLIIVSDAVKADAFVSYDIATPLYFTSISNPRVPLDRMLLKLVGNLNKSMFDVRTPFFLGDTQAIKKIRSMLPGLVASVDPVLVTGEEGTGKELLARLIAGRSGGGNAILKIDCSALQPEILIQDWLEEVMNTHVAARPVIIFLDGIHQISKRIQAEILLVLERASQWDSGINNSGAIRIISSTKVPMAELLRTGEFREDLGYRLNVIPIHMPPLRDRKEDIDLLMDYFIIRAQVSRNKGFMIPSSKARKALRLYHWPGNVKELKTYMQRVAMTGSESCIFDNNTIPKIRKNSLEYFLETANTEGLPKIHEIKSSLSQMRDLSLKGVCEEFISRTEKNLMRKALETTNWNRKKAAELLNISYKSMLNKMKAYDIA